MAVVIVSRFINQSNFAGLDWTGLILHLHFQCQKLCYTAEGGHAQQHAECRMRIHHSFQSPHSAAAAATVPFRFVPCPEPCPASTSEPRAAIESSNLPPRPHSLIIPSALIHSHQPPPHLRQLPDPQPHPHPHPHPRPHPRFHSHQDLHRPPLHHPPGARRPYCYHPPPHH